MGAGEHDRTQVDPAAHAAFTATLAAPGQGPPASAVTGVSMVRTTVLPRAEASAGAVALVADARERYAHERLLGEGGVGEVVRAIDNDIARPVAIKRIRREVNSPAMLLRFVEEIRTIGQLEHPNIVPIHDVGVDERGDYFFVMKYVEGETLEHVIERLAAGDPAYHATYDVEHRVRIFTAILEAVAHAHARGFVHRDLKPANVMIGPHGQVMVMDWGLAKRVGTPDTPAMLAAHAAAPRLQQTAVGAVLGTPAYMAPEQARGAEATFQSDVYSLCVLFWELLTTRHYLDDCQTLEAMLDGVQRRDAPMATTVSSPYQRPTPMDLSWFLAAGLAKDPAKRFTSVDAMLHRLSLRAQGIIPVQCPITFTMRATGVATRALQRYPFHVMGALALGAVSTLGAIGLLALRALG